ncbi:hypothetical protein N836_12915 [Leptolyngbya sp. Heron Island J]|uniref:hypothetical protein n=1 Tax=Leptolyngbya sp. Heron Island J TaxID=1385935 RepID=UPI0003B94E1B|nr:hypothetical protein [Leptolyngbya sp. Heron Island J]ESA35272.1 hypothetical protein N836_12915 [Leptolyngbya sp. Heron Island J]
MTKFKLALSCNLAAIVIVALLALIYLFTPQLLPYQQTTIGTNWSDLGLGLQTQFLSLMKVAGGGYLATAACLAVLLWILFRRRETWARMAIPAIGIPAILIVNYAGLTIMHNTPGRPPLIAGPITITLFIAGFILSANSARQQISDMSSS